MGLEDVFADCNVDEDFQEHIASGIEYTTQDLTDLAYNLLQYHNKALDENYKNRILKPAVKDWAADSPALEKTREVHGTSFYKRT